MKLFVLYLMPIVFILFFSTFSPNAELSVTDKTGDNSMASSPNDNNSLLPPIKKGENSVVKIDIRSEVELLEKRRKDLDEREEGIKKEEDRIEQIRADVKGLMAKYSSIRDEAEKACKEVSKKEEDHYHQLIKVYESMPAEEAALRIDKMDEKIAIKILTGMKEKAAAKVIASMNPAKASRLSEMFTKK